MNNASILLALWEKRGAIFLALSTLGATVSGTWFAVVRPAIAQVVDEEVGRETEARLDEVEEALQRLQEAADTGEQSADATSFMLGLILQEQRRFQCEQEGRADCE